LFLRFKRLRKTIPTSKHGEVDGRRPFAVPAPVDGHHAQLVDGVHLQAVDDGLRGALHKREVGRPQVVTHGPVQHLSTDGKPVE